MSGGHDRQTVLTRRLVDSLYVEAMLLADEARSYFDGPGRSACDALPGVLKVGFACESLKVTTRLMHVIAWLLSQRAVAAGELDPGGTRHAAQRLGRAVTSDDAVLAGLPACACSLIVASRDLYARVARIDGELRRAAGSLPSPVRGLIRQLEQAF